MQPLLRRLVLSLALLLSLSPSVRAAAPPRPNIIVLLCDDLGYGDLACFAHPTIKTPNLDRLAADGIKFTHCYSSFPVCSPSRAGLMTGRNANRSGIRDWIPPRSGIALRTNEVTVATLLKRAGYRTCHAGKWHLNSLVDGTEPTPGDHGFDHWFYTQNNAAPSHANPTNFIRNGRPVGPLTGYSSGLVVDEAIRFLDAAPGKPFFLNLWFHESHEPIAAAEEFTRLYPEADNPNRAQYYGDVTQMDHAVGRLLKHLDSHGLRDNTFIIFTSDNGPETLNRYQGAQRSYGTPGPLRGMKLHVTEAGYRVPGILRWPGHATPGTVSAEPISNLDFLPTFCELAGVPVPADRPIDGTSLLPILAGKPLTRAHPLYWQYDRALSKPWTVALRDGPWKLLANATLDQFELYDLSKDIGEKQNLAASETARLARMTTALKQLHAEINTEGARSGNPVPKASGGK